LFASCGGHTASELNIRIEIWYIIWLYLHGGSLVGRDFRKCQRGWIIEHKGNKIGISSRQTSIDGSSRLVSNDM
jgi:hypothetical protein